MVSRLPAFFQHTWNSWLQTRCVLCEHTLFVAGRSFPPAEKLLTFLEKHFLLNQRCLVVFNIIPVKTALILVYESLRFFHPLMIIAYRTYACDPGTGKMLHTFEGAVVLVCQKITSGPDFLFKRHARFCGIKFTYNSSSNSSAYENNQY